MANRRIRRLVLLGVPLLVMGVAGYALYVLWLPESERSDAADLGAFLLAAGVFVASAIGRLSREGAGTDSTSTPTDSDVLDRLAGVVQMQWRGAASERGLLALPLPVRWKNAWSTGVSSPEAAVSAERFKPIPGFSPVRSTVETQEGDRSGLLSLYSGLPSGRLILLGGPGTGKTAAAIYLLSDAIDHRSNMTGSERNEVPVPVLVTLHGWSPDTSRRTRSALQWVARKLSAEYADVLSREKAEALLREGRISVFFDGLDELVEELRPRVLAALGDAPFRVVVLSRTQEAVTAVQHGPLSNSMALELAPVNSDVAAEYLERAAGVSPPPPDWQALADYLRSRSGDKEDVLVRALRKPLTISLIRDGYALGNPLGHESVGELHAFRSVEDIDNHLLGRAVAIAYSRVPGRKDPPYNQEDAHATLRWLAREMNARSTKDLEWWEVPSWVNPDLGGIFPTRTVLGLRSFVHGVRSRPTLIIAFAVMSVTLFDFRYVNGLIGMLAVSSLGVLVAGLTGNVPLERGTRSPAEVWQLDKKSHWRYVLIGGALVVVTSGGLFGLDGLRSGATWLRAVLPFTGVVEIHTEGALESFAAGTLVGLCLAVPFATLFGFAGLLTLWLPPAVIRWLRPLAAGTTVALLAPVIVSRFLGTEWEAAATYSQYLALLLFMFTVNPSSASFATSAAMPRLALRHRVQVRLIPFLEHARSAHILRTVGAVYQFRHATLQDWLARTPETRSLRAGMRDH